MNIRFWLQDLADAFNYRMTNERQIAAYEKYIAKLGLTEAEMVSLKDQITEEFDKFPSIAQIYSTGRSATRTKNSVEPRWRTWKDREGRLYGQKLSGWQATVPTNEDLERWKQEASSTEEGTTIFREAFVKAGGDISKLPLTKSMAMRQAS